MSLESALYAVLAPVCARTFPDVAPIDTVRPYITWQQIGGMAPTYIERAVVDLRNAEIQVNVWAATRAEANTLALAVEQALTEATTLQAMPRAAFIATHDELISVYGTMQDFSIWATR